MNSFSVNKDNLDYLTKYGISSSLAYEVHKIVSKYPQLLSIFEATLSTVSYSQNETPVYELLKKINQELARVK